MANLFTDNFTRANAANLGSNWDADDSGNNIDWDLDTNTAENQFSANNGQWTRTTSSAHAATADVKVSVTTVGSGHDGGPLARCTSVGNTTKEAYVVYASSGGISIVRNNASGAETQLGSTIAITAAAAKVVAIEVSGTGATVTIKSYYDGVLKDTQSDSSASRLTAAGRTGMTNWAALGTNSRWDDFTVDDLAAGGGATVTYPMLERMTRGLERGLNHGIH